MAPLQGLPWKGLGTEAPGQPGAALLLPPAKAYVLCSRPWLIMEMTVMRNQTRQVSMLHCTLLVMSCMPSQHIALQS